MAMTISDANAAQTLIGWMLDRATMEARGLTEDHVFTALVHLADRSHDTLHAGMRSADVDKRVRELGGIPA